MIIEKIICDCCGEEIPKIKKKDLFGIEREYYIFGKLNCGDTTFSLIALPLGIYLIFTKEKIMMFWLSMI